MIKASSSVLPSPASITATPPKFVKIVAFSVFSLTAFFLFRYFYVSPTVTVENHDLSFFSPTAAVVAASPPLVQLPNAPPPPPPFPLMERTGIVNELGVMTEDFVVGEFDEELIQSMVTNVDVNISNEKITIDFGKVIKLEKFRVCDERMSDYIPCLDNMETMAKFNSSERHCPENGKGLDCLVPRPKGYRLHIPWPKSRDEVWLNNVPRTQLIEGNESRMSRKRDKLIFQGGRNKFISNVNQYLDQIAKMVPEIAFGQHTRVALDVGSGVASFGAYLMERNVTTLSISSKDVRGNPVQLALERGVPAMLAGFGTQRLPFPTQAFDLIHCSSKINWTHDDGIQLLEANRILRAGGYFVWASEPVYKSENELVEQWKEMEEHSHNICWTLLSKEGYLAIWQKPLNNSCYLNRGLKVPSPICAADENPDDIWYGNPKPCITRLPENGYGANITNWPARLHSPPDRLFTIQMDSFRTRRELYKADSNYRHDIVKGYVDVFHLKELNIRNVMDMRAGYGGFAAALLDLQVDCWIMNVVPVSSSNTLPVIYDRGLIGVMHDWCEPFSTYPRTYDLLNAEGLFSVERSRCNITNIMLEMDRMLRPGGRAYIRDTTAVIFEVEEIAKAMGWVTFLFDSGEGPHSQWKLLNCEKRL